MSGFLPAGYNKAGGASAKGTARMAGLIRGIAILVMTLFLLALDLMLSVSLVISQSANVALPQDLGDRFMYIMFGSGSDLSLGGKVIPWLFSLGTTGLVYALWNPPKSAQKSWIRYVGWAMALMDTGTDVGGLNALLTGDPSAGTNIIPSKNMPGMYIFFDIVVAIACLAQEPILKLLLGQQQARANMATNDPGAPIESGFLNISGHAFSVINAISMIVGSAGLLLLDIVLTPQMPSDQPQVTYILWGFSIFIFALQLGAWRLIRRIREANQTLSQQPNRVKIVALGIGIMATVDTILDLKGYNSSLYGTSDFIVPEPTAVWWLMATMIVIMTLFGEPLNDALFGNLWENFHGGGGPAGGISFGGPSGPSPFPPAMPAPGGPPKPAGPIVFPSPPKPPASGGDDLDIPDFLK